MKLKFLGAARTVTGSKYLLNYKDKKILIDCGLFQGLKDLRLLNWDNLPFDPTNIDAVLLTHAHIDHSGYIPKLVKSGFSGPIYSTFATYDLCSILLTDSGSIQEEDARRANKYGYSKHHPAEPLYTRKDAEIALKHFKPIEFNKLITINKDIKATWLRAGHILGASFIKLEIDSKEIVFTGDMGRFHDPVMNPPEYIKTADYLILESTYGNRLHENIDVYKYIADVINNTLKRNGTILIPSFAVGRAQSILYYIYKLKMQKRIPDVPVFLDSPMSVKATELMQNHLIDHKLDKEQCEKVCSIAEYIKTQKESKELFNINIPKIIISASGMITGGRILHHVEHFGPDPKNTILLVGYQVEGTRGFDLLNNKKTLKMHGKSININAEVKYLSNLSAHADYSEILEWLKKFNTSPGKTFITHGEISSSNSLKNKIQENLGWDCYIPEYLEEVSL